MSDYIFPCNPDVFNAWKALGHQLQGVATAGAGLAQNPMEADEANVREWLSVFVKERDEALAELKHLEERTAAYVAACRKV